MQIQESFYDEDYFYNVENRIWMGAHQERIADILSFFPKEPCRILDYGAGSGYFSYKAMACGHEVEAYDYAECSEQFVKTHYPYVRIKEHDSALVYNCIFLFDVIEHIATDEQVSFINRLRDHLVQEGAIILSTDNDDSFFSMTWLGDLLQRIDARLTKSGRMYRLIKNSEYKRPYYKKYTNSHVGLLGRNGVTRLMNECGFELVKEKHGFLYKSPLSKLVSIIFKRQPLHSVYLFKS